MDEVQKVSIYQQESPTTSEEWMKLFFPMEVKVNESNTITKSPLESGIKHFDYKVFDPSDIEVLGFVYADTKNKLMSMVDSGMDEMDFKKSLYVVQSKGGTHFDLVMVGAKESDEKDMFDVIKVTLVFSQVLIENVSSGNNNGNSATANVGLMGGS